jgi:hypothetical protein
MGRKQLVTRVLVVPQAFDRFCEDFNAGRFYEAHEHLEEVWQFERGAVRDLYKGLIQAAAAYVHLSRGGYPGALRLLTTSLEYLTPYRQRGAMGFDVDRIARALEAAREEVLRLGPSGLARFPLQLRPVMAYDRNLLGSEARLWRAWGFDDQGTALQMEVTLAA